jgi:DNA-binding NarL/FixJ family response regulator
MQTPEDVQAMLKLASLGWGAKRINRELGYSRNTVS